MNSAKATILIVDDEPINLDIICAHLEDDSYELIRTNNGEEAWSMLEAAPIRFDTIILDRMMPGMDGMQLLCNIKDNDLMEHVPVVMQTGKAESHDIVEGIEVERRLNASENIDGCIELEFEVAADTVQIRIRDQGPGFDWTPYMDFDPDRAFDPHGRGIAVARLSSFDELEFIGAGNEVLATVIKGLDG